MKLYNDKCENVLDQMEENSIDAVVTDPPYGLSFMGKKWDYNVPSVSTFEKILRVMKPGATLLCFAGARTQHRMAVNIEDAGFILKDTLMWLYGSGFPKATDIGKQIDTWNGWKSHGLKPAYEPIIMAIKPNEGSYAENALKWGISGINIDECRIPMDVSDVNMRPNAKNHNKQDGTSWGTISDSKGESKHTQDMGFHNSKGRYPANVILTHHPECEEDCHEDCPVKMLDDQSGILESGGSRKPRRPNENRWGGLKKEFSCEDIIYNDSGGASRFFYCAKASKSERNIGCGDIIEKRGSDDYRPNDDGTKGLQSRLHGATKKGSNNHPTVKPVELMKYLCKMVSMPTKITILDPFMGSGTTGMACIELGLDFIGMEKDKEYFEIAESRSNHIVDEVIEKPKRIKKAIDAFF